MCPHNSRSHWTAILHQMAGTLWMLLFVALNVFYGRWNEEYKTERGWLTIHRTIDSQKHSGWKSPLKLPCLKPTHPHRVHQCHISTVLQCLQGWWPQHFHGQPVPVHYHSFGREIFPNGRSVPHHVHFWQELVLRSCTEWSCSSLPFLFWVRNLHSSVRDKYQRKSSLVLQLRIGTREDGEHQWVSMQWGNFSLQIHVLRAMDIS